MRVISEAARFANTTSDSIATTSPGADRHGVRLHTDSIVGDVNDRSTASSSTAIALVVRVPVSAASASSAPTHYQHVHLGQSVVGDLERTV